MKAATTKEQKRKCDVKAKAFFSPGAISTVEKEKKKTKGKKKKKKKNSVNRGTKMHGYDRHFRLEKFFVNCWAYAMEE